MGLAFPPYYGKKKSKFFAKKINRARAKIEKQEKIIAACEECEKQLAENENACAKTEN